MKQKNRQYNAMGQRIALYQPLQAVAAVKKVKVRQIMIINDEIRIRKR